MSPRLVPLILASPLFLQNLDSSAMATALPAIAASLQVPPLHLNLAITSYLVSLAVFLPLHFLVLGEALAGARRERPVDEAGIIPRHVGAIFNEGQAVPLELGRVQSFHSPRQPRPQAQWQAPQAREELGGKGHDSI